MKTKQIASQSVYIGEGKKQQAARITISFDPNIVSEALVDEALDRATSHIAEETAREFTKLEKFKV